MTTEYDVTIIGGGPAGATLARLLAPRYRVLLVDKRPLDAPHRFDVPGKCCGGLLAPDAQKILAKLGLGLPRHLLLDPQPFAVRVTDLAVGITRTYPRNYLNMDREAFDRWLLEQVGERVDVCARTRFSDAEEVGGRVRVRLDYGGNMRTVTTRLLVGADGAASQVRHRFFTDRSHPERYVALQRWFEGTQPGGCFYAFFDPAVTDFYGWAIPKDDHLLVGAALPPGRDAEARFERLLGQIRWEGLHLGDCVKREAALLLRPRKRDEIQLGGDGVVLVGEAAGWISPSSAEGLSFAFRSALALAGALCRGDDAGLVERYRRRALGLYFGLWAKRCKSPVLYHPALRRLVMGSGVGALRACTGS